jgi:hypothetical protein
MIIFGLKDVSCWRFIVIGCDIGELRVIMMYWGLCVDGWFWGKVVYNILINSI